MKMLTATANQKTVTQANTNYQTQPNLHNHIGHQTIEDERAFQLAVELTMLCLNSKADSELDGDFRGGNKTKSQNTTECVPVPSSEHVAEIVGRQGCKIKGLRAKTNTYIKTPVRGEEPVFVVTGRKEDVNAAKNEILSAAEHFTHIRLQRKNNINGVTLGNGVGGFSGCQPGVTGIGGGAGVGLGTGASGGGVGVGGVVNQPVPGQTTIQVRVPYRVVGLVVGPKGATIKRIQQTTNTYIITPSREKEPVFEVTGLPDNVESARKEIEAHIALRTGVLSDTSVKYF